MPQSIEIRSEKNACSANRRWRFRTGGAPRDKKLALFPHEPHAFPATSRDRLDEYRIAELLRDALGVFDSLDRILNPGHHWHAGARGKLSRSSFRSKAFHCLRRRADERHVIFRAVLCEGGIFSQESVAGMHGVTTHAPRDIDQLVDP